MATSHCGAGCTLGDIAAEWIVGMILGFATAYPVNWWLVRKGVKESM